MSKKICKIYASIGQQRNCTNKNNKTFKGQYIYIQSVTIGRCKMKLLNHLNSPALAKVLRNLFDLCIDLTVTTL